jgi:putative oxidoreductase
MNRHFLKFVLLMNPRGSIFCEFTGLPMVGRGSSAVQRLKVKFAPQIYAIMRIVIGLMFAVHGCQKLFGIPPSVHATTLDTLMLIGGIIEFFGGLMIAFGLFAGYAAFIASGQMAVAYFMAHFPKKWSSIYDFIPAINGGELAVMYCFVFLFIAAYGSGVWSLDSMLGIARKETK